MDTQGSDHCDSCEAIMILGVYCHETGCPAEARRRMHTCRECDEPLEQDGRLTWYCPSCDTCYACGMFDDHSNDCSERG